MGARENACLHDAGCDGRSHSIFCNEAWFYPVHWIADAPTSLHGNGAASFERTTRVVAEVTCRLCLSLLAKVSDYPCETCGGPVLAESAVCLLDNERATR